MHNYHADHVYLKMNYDAPNRTIQYNLTPHDAKHVSIITKAANTNKGRFNEK